jgi:hypothetical protein
LPEERLDELLDRLSEEQSDPLPARLLGQQFDRLPSLQLAKLSAPLFARESTEVSQECARA